MKRLAAILALLLCAAPVFALNVREARWGFDGKIVPRTMNIVSVLIDNPTGTNFEGDLALYRTVSFQGSVGEKFLQHVFVSAGSSRWVQFYVYCSSADDWSLTWGGGKYEMPKPLHDDANAANNWRIPPTAPARVMLTAPDDPFVRSTDIRVFPDNLFPPTVAATDALDTVVIDYVPKWEPARREAFLDWLKHGGTLHISLDREGKFPEFNAELSVLNQPLDTFHVGGGTVWRHRLPRREMTNKYLAEQFPPLEVQTGEGQSMGLEEHAFRELGEVSQPHFSWGLIFTIAVIYVLLIGPANFLVGRKVRDYRWAIGFFFLAVMLFGYCFNIMGRRGYGESTTVRSVAWARSLGSDTYDVTQWENVFVTSGAVYALQHDSPHNLYSTCQEYEAVKGVALNGKEGKLVVDIPMYSSRGFLHRAKMKGDDTSLKVLTWESGEWLNKLELGVTADFPKNIQHIWILHHDRIYGARLNGNIIELDANGSERFEDFADARKLFGDNDGWGGRYYGRTPWSSYDTTESPERRLDRVNRLLVVNALGGAKSFVYYTPGKLHLPVDQIRVFICADIPEGFKLTDKRFKKQLGYVIYQVDVQQKTH